MALYEVIDDEGGGVRGEWQGMRESEITDG